VKSGDLVVYTPKGTLPKPVPDSVLLLVTHPDDIHAKYSGCFSVRDVGMVVEPPDENLVYGIWVRILCSGGIGWVVRREISVIP
jgi:hypothetical protein